MNQRTLASEIPWELKRRLLQEYNLEPEVFSNEIGIGPDRYGNLVIVTGPEQAGKIKDANYPNMIEEEQLVTVPPDFDIWRFLFAKTASRKTAGADWIEYLEVTTKSPQEALRDLHSVFAEEERQAEGYGGTPGGLSLNLIKVELPKYSRNPYAFAGTFMDDRRFDKWEGTGFYEIPIGFVKRERPQLAGKRGLHAYLFFGWVPI